MKRVIAIADRAALVSLKLLVALNVLFFLSFLIVALLAGRAHAETPACGGTDMLSALRKDNPTVYSKIEAEAAATPNGKGLLWKLEKPGEKPSFLFGTMHMTDPRVTTLPPAAQKAFDAADTVVIETTEVLDQQKMMAALLKEPDLMMFTDSTTLSSLLSPDDAAAMNKALDARGIPPATVAKMKPWLLSAMVALPACELARKAGGAPVLDVKLAEDAKASGKSVEGLETVADQLHAMASLPLAFHMKGLVDTLKLGDKVNDVNETMIVLYQSGETGMFWPLFRVVLPGDEDDPAGYAAFEETMITSRNKVMADHAGPLLARGNAFMAVGAMHLPGPQGLVEDLRKAGYTVTAVD
ncbi:polysaccharide biosynthesis protein GumN [Mesorhizobium sp. M4B.F.Ca.ET.215.01.1.1]|uniref:TraB/GumN family protein n=1 Tax=unclassified Mesorhizobium TaxID=325217 RepID=UPI000FCAFA07|nr:MULTISPECIES: TraB/GumN family protein [unclassified Mesorhizobium]RVC62873.1 polysaccharide biosynthesis protein GumN [Mesorhizobium sp. M4B.F.Ca.ET.088.02.2.1]RUW28273.1 polysaccharide biosynthesis protein GumN [Mesorhizobium sp. M4B.F.Ca.ET.013.02.1.1]RVD40746.1 polysaccharide biosynthesis protein GumN [Mesorhizobium sp. M4B.F.Ca.ET.019.03.1.1]RWF27074.1 MAG: polysaccharide biosynthesis protein GumN [Mesorhizobium sp.]RWF39732.1 MAG: polysaccharide biosynthesis protein GumN [Mesorhizobiu